MEKPAPQRAAPAFARRALFAAIAASTMILPAAPASAHGALGNEQEACLLKIGPDFMYFSGYMPDDGGKKFCEDIPKAGRAIIVLDFGQPELRDMNVDMRVMRLEGDGADAVDGPVVATLAPRKYPSGTLDFEHAFTETGTFVGVVTATAANGEQWVARYPFYVGGDHSGRTPYYLIAAAALLAFLRFAWARGESSKPRSPKS